jgi:hypothetical protein
MPGKGLFIGGELPFQAFSDDTIIRLLPRVSETEHCERLTVRTTSLISRAMIIGVKPSVSKKKLA